MKIKKPSKKQEFLILSALVVLLAVLITLLIVKHNHKIKSENIETASSTQAIASQVNSTTVAELATEPSVTAETSVETTTEAKKAVSTTKAVSATKATTSTTAKPVTTNPQSTWTQEMVDSIVAEMKSYCISKGLGIDSSKTTKGTSWMNPADTAWSSEPERIKSNLKYQIDCVYNGLISEGITPDGRACMNVFAVSYTDYDGTTQWEIYVVG